MNFKGIKYKIIQELAYLNYELKSGLGIRVIGYGKYDGLIIIKLLKKHKPPIYSMHVVSISKDFETVDFEVIHDYGLRLDKSDYVSIILNPISKNIHMVVGKNLKQHIDNFKEIEIINIMKNKVEFGEIIKGLESGMKTIKQCLTNI